MQLCSDFHTQSPMERAQVGRTEALVVSAIKKALKPLPGGLFHVVEVRRLELLTPYMRSKCSTS